LHVFARQNVIRCNLRTCLGSIKKLIKIIPRTAFSRGTKTHHPLPCILIFKTFAEGSEIRMAIIFLQARQKLFADNVYVTSTSLYLSNAERAPRADELLKQKVAPG